MADIVVNSHEELSRATFDQLYREHAGAVYGYACYLTRDRTEADDIFQDTWLRVARNQPAEINPKSAKSWIFTIATNLYRDSLRKKKVRRLFMGRAVQPDFSEETACSDMGRDLARAIAALPDRQRRIFVLKEIAGFQQAEISDILDIPLGTVKSLMFRAVRQLRRELTDYSPKNLIRRGSYAL